MVRYSFILRNVPALPAKLKCAPSLRIARAPRGRAGDHRESQADGRTAVEKGKAAGRA